MKHAPSREMVRSGKLTRLRFGWLAVLTLAVAACAPAQPMPSTTLDTVPQYVELSSGGTSTLNYTPWYIHTWQFTGPKGTRIGGGGPNVMPAKEDQYPAGGGKESCCASFPHDWQPDLRLTVRWLVDKKLDGKTPGSWYKAESVQIPRYAGGTGGVTAIFLPGDKVRLMIPSEGTDVSFYRYSPWNHAPAPANDPYAAQGVIDDEWNYWFPNGHIRSDRK